MISLNSKVQNFVVNAFNYGAFFNYGSIDYYKILDINFVIDMHQNKKAKKIILFAGADHVKNITKILSKLNYKVKKIDKFNAYQDQNSNIFDCINL